ncbi:MAG TPA: hypothetical protein VGG69_01515 [Rhizomicrobium sp.]
MADTRSKSERDAAVNRAQKHFAASEQRDASIKQMIEDERTAVAVRTAKLRAQRLAKEETDRIAAESAPKAAAKPAKRKRAINAG